MYTPSFICDSHTMLAGLELGGWLIVSGGDDNSLYGALLTNSTESSKVGWCTTASGLNSHAHCSSITGIKEML